MGASEQASRQMKSSIPWVYAPRSASCRVGRVEGEHGTVETLQEQLPQRGDRLEAGVEAHKQGVVFRSHGRDQGIGAEHGVADLGVGIARSITRCNSSDGVGSVAKVANQASGWRIPAGLTGRSNQKRTVRRGASGSSTKGALDLSRAHSCRHT